MVDTKLTAKRSLTSELEQSQAAMASIGFQQVLDGTQPSSGQHDGVERSNLVPEFISRCAPPMTLYHILFVSLTLGLGIWKSVASYKNHAFTMNIFDWVIGYILTISWHELGVIGEKPFASSNLAWFYKFDYAHCVFGSIIIFAEATLFVVKTCLYGTLFFNGAILSILYLLVTSSNNPPSIPDFVKAYIGFIAFLMISYILLFLIYLSASCGWPLIGFTNDPFWRSLDPSVKRLSSGCGPLHRMAYKVFLRAVLLISAITAICCMWFSVVKIIEYGDSIRV